MRVGLDAEKCNGHARCFAVDPDLFPLDNSGYSVLEPRTVAPGDEVITREAAEVCPEGAIVIETSA
jgi:ferredoxin